MQRPTPKHPYSSSEGSEDFVIDRNDSWEDAEPDEEEIQITSLFDNKTFSDVRSMLEYCKQRYEFDLLQVKKQLGLDFYSSIKLVNYVRSEVKKGNMKPEVSSVSFFGDDKYLQPVLDDDGLLFSLDELSEDDGLTSAEMSAHDDSAKEGGSKEDASAKIKDLEAQLQRLQSQHTQYRKTVEETLEKRWQEEDDTHGDSTKEDSDENRDHDYFDSYSYNDIHELMLKDTVRTDAYRDFIYDNKHLFEGKTVLDVGCGTGILSMFCARAGAAKVIAVDNSNIIDKARINVIANNLSNRIVCLRGKIEQVVLPVQQVDIIISEWMGYCLLFEAMLDSVLWARDKYLSPDGLMVPSHCVLHIAPLIDPEYVSENVEFWYDVYGFDMTAMMEKIYDDVLVRQLSTSNLAAKSNAFFQLPLHTIEAKDLDFVKDFSVTISQNIENLDGWVVWFDTFFLHSRTINLPLDARAEDWKPGNRSGVAFTTGPAGKETHWRSGVMLVDRKKHPPTSLKQGSVIKGSITYKKANKNGRGLEMAINWNAEHCSERGSQVWFMR